MRKSLGLAFASGETQGVPLHAAQFVAYKLIEEGWKLADTTVLIRNVDGDAEGLPKNLSWRARTRPIREGGSRHSADFHPRALGPGKFGVARQLQNDSGYP